MLDSRTIIDSLSDGLYTVNREGRITYWNRAAEAITGYRAEDVQGLPCHEGPLKHVDSKGRDLCSQACPLISAIEHGRRHEADVFLHHKEGHRVPVRMKVSPLRDVRGRVVGAVELFSDNTEQMLALERLAELEEVALLDPLTGLANKTYLDIQSQRYLREMVRQPLAIGVLVIEIDGFETLCRPFNASARNRLLQVVAETIRSNCRPLDLFGHVDDGCFVGLLHEVSGSRLYAVARKQQVLIEKSHFFTGDQIVSVTVSIGGTLLRKDDTLQSAVARCERQLAPAGSAEPLQHIAVDSLFEA